MTKQEFETAQAIIKMNCPDIKQDAYETVDRRKYDYDSPIQYILKLKGDNMPLNNIVKMIKEFDRRGYRFADHADGGGFVEVFKINR